MSIRYLASQQLSSSLFLKIVLGGFFCCFSTGLLTIPSAEATSLPTARLRIQQEKIKHKDGVLISRPKSVDFKIINLIQVHNIHSLEDYARWLKENIHYKKDEKKDQWATPEETLRKKRGDCEDYTFFNAEVLQVLGYQPRVLAVRKDRQAHAICVFKAGEHYFWFDNAELKKTRATTLAGFLQNIRTNHNYFAFSELDLKTNQWSALSKKSLL